MMTHQSGFDSRKLKMDEVLISTVTAKSPHNDPQAHSISFKKPIPLDKAIKASESTKIRLHLDLKEPLKITGDKFGKLNYVELRVKETTKLDDSESLESDSDESISEEVQLPNRNQSKLISKSEEASKDSKDDSLAFYLSRNQDILLTDSLRVSEGNHEENKRQEDEQEDIDKQKSDGEGSVILREVANFINNMLGSQNIKDQLKSTELTEDTDNQIGAGQQRGKDEDNQIELPILAEDEATAQQSFKSILYSSLMTPDTSYLANYQRLSTPKSPITFLSKNNIPIIKQDVKIKPLNRSPSDISPCQSFLTTTTASSVQNIRRSDSRQTYDPKTASSESSFDIGKYVQGLKEKSAVLDVTWSKKTNEDETWTPWNDNRTWLTHIQMDAEGIKTTMSQMSHDNQISFKTIDIDPFSIDSLTSIAVFTETDDGSVKQIHKCSLSELCDGKRDLIANLSITNETNEMYQEVCVYKPVCDDDPVKCEKTREALEFRAREPAHAYDETEPIMPDILLYYSKPNDPEQFDWIESSFQQLDDNLALKDGYYLQRIYYRVKRFSFKFGSMLENSHSTQSIQ